MTALPQPFCWYPSTSSSARGEQREPSAIPLYAEGSTADEVTMCQIPGEEKVPVWNYVLRDTGASPSVVIITSTKPSAAQVFDFELEQTWTYSPEKYSSIGLFHCPNVEPENVRWIVDDLGEKGKRVIGEEGNERIQEFKSYEKGWDFGRGEPLSSLSMAVVETFLNLYPELSQIKPSVFLTRLGNLQLGWEDKDDNPIEIEFFPDKVEYYIGCLDEEGKIQLNPDNPSEGLQQTIAKVQSLCHE